MDRGQISQLHAGRRTPLFPPNFPTRAAVVGSLSRRQKLKASIAGGGGGADYRLKRLGVCAGLGGGPGGYFRRDVKLEAGFVQRFRHRFHSLQRIAIHPFHALAKARFANASAGASLTACRAAQ